MSEEEEEWICDLVISFIVGIGVLVSLRSAPENLLNLILDIGEKILNHIHVSGQGISISQNFRWLADFIYRASLTEIDLFRFCIGFFPALGIMRFRRNRVRKKKSSYW